ncbi:MAG: hypothetical protein V4850_01225 [Myxococcota bacterium]
MNKQPLRLERVEIAGIRNINWAPDGGPGLAFDLGAVTIISAPNGVAKSSFIEALTLGLTGAGRRRGAPLTEAAYVHSPRPKPALRARVTLSFGADAQLVWEEGQDTRLTQQATSALLTTRTDSPEAVANLLRLTHLLPQGWGERFTDHEGSARWTLVERALDLNGMREAVRAAQGKGPIGVALSRRVQDATRVYEEARAARERWDARVKDWTEAREIGLDEGALPPAEAAARLAEVCEVLGVSSPFTVERARTAIEERRLTFSNKLASATRLHAKIQSSEEEVAVCDAQFQTAATTKMEAALNLGVARGSFLRAMGAAAQAALPELRSALLQAERADRGWQLRARADTLERLERAAREAEAKLVEFQEPDTLDAVEASAAADLAKLQGDAEQARSRLAERERAHGELARILRELRPHIEQDTHDPRSCPVCEKPSETLLDDLDVKLRALGDDATDDARERHTAAAEAVRLATEHLKAARLRSQTAASTRSEATRARSTLTAELARSLAAFPEYVLTPDAGQRAAAMRSDAALSGAEGITAEEARATRVEASRKVVEAEEAVRAAEPAVAEGADTPTVEVARHRLELAERALTEADDAIAAAGQRLGHARGSLDALLVELSRLALPELAGTRVAGLPATIEALGTAHASRLDELTTRVDATKRGVDAYAGLSAVRRAEVALRAEAESAGVEAPEVIGESWVQTTAEGLLEREFTAQREAATGMKRTETVTKWVSTLSKELQSFEDECLKEMDPTVTAFLEALAPTMRWRLSLAKNRNAALTRLAGEGAPDVSPADLLSEGEHTAVALAYLLAFHTRQRWSRWPALVLDDPFQAADVVRVGALLDVLRNLCVEQGTQLILTTHEPQLAEWTARKMRNAGIDTRHYELERTAAGVAARLSGGGAAD